MRKSAVLATVAVLALAGCGNGSTDEVSADQVAASEQAATAEQPDVAEELPAAPPAEPNSAFALVSAHRWSTWGSPCNGALQATYKPDKGQVIFRYGQLLQDSNKPNVVYNFSENSDGSFTFHKVSADSIHPDVIVSILRERIYAESDTRIRIERKSVDLSDAAVLDYSIRRSNPTDNPELYQTVSETLYEERCS